MSSNRDDVTPPYTQPKAPKSSLVVAALIFLGAAFVLAFLAAVFVLPYIALFAVVDGLAAVTLAVLSLRERG